MRTTILFLFISTFLSLLLHSAYAGPGKHQYNVKGHSNYGDGKKNKKHVEEHMKAIAKDSDKAAGDEQKKEKPDMSEEDMIYYLFVIHDLNGDGYLDGHELRAAFTDFDHDEEERHNIHTGSMYKVETIPFDEITEMVDHVLEEDDKNGDGLISWSEYLESQLYHEE